MNMLDTTVMWLNTVKILNIGTGRSEQKVETQIRLLLRSSLIRVYPFAIPFVSHRCMNAAGTRSTVGSASD